MKANLLVLVGFGLLPIVAAANIKNPLPIKKGIYVDEEVACENPDAADTYGYYGDSFAPGHNSCRFHAVKRGMQGVYNTLLSCTDLPSNGSTKYSSTFVVLSETRVVIATRVGSPAIIRWCADSINEIKFAP